MNGTKYAVKLVTQINANTGKFLFKEVGSGNTSCKTWIGSIAQLTKFSACVTAKIGAANDPGIVPLIKNELGL